MIDFGPIEIEDDYDVIIQNDSNHENGNVRPRMDVIVIDDVEDLTQNTIADIIEIDDEPEHQNKSKQLKYFCDSSYKENKLLQIFVEKCLDLENTDGMLRVINRTLLCGYRDTTQAFKKSPEFEKTMQKAINLIKADPGHKFSHVKYVCEVFKKHKFRKKLGFMTLKPLIKGSVENKHKRQNAKSRMAKKQKTDTIIEIDDPTILEEPTMNIEEDESDSNVINDVLIQTDKILVLENVNSNIENDLICDGPIANNTVINKNIEALNNGVVNGLTIVPSKEDVHSGPNNIVISSEQGTGDVSDELLVPQRDAQFASHTSDCNNIAEEKVIKIEKMIEFYKTSIAQLEEEEVVDNTSNSPYIRSEKMKADITKLYKKLCSLTGEEPVKRYEVHLNVTDGHPPGPVKELEKFINDRIGSNGEPPFPDFGDVVKCVAKANRSENLGWKRPQVMREANLLFVQCGRALQKRRQRREWRDMLGRVKQKKLEYDPADEDPELKARLEENKLIALGKEADLLERYVNMENSLPSISNPNLTLENDSDYNSENDDRGSNQDIHQTHITSEAPSAYRESSFPKESSHSDLSQNTNGTISCLIYTHKVIKDCSNVNNTQNPLKRMDFINDLKTIVKSESVNNVHEQSREATQPYQIYKEDINFNAIGENLLTNDEITNGFDKNIPDPSKTEDEINICVKPEPEDIPMLLEELGNNYTSTIFDVEDPFLIIEISSDSSDGESDHER